MVLAIVVATIASFVFSALLYAVPPVAAFMEDHSTPRPGIPVAAQMGAVLVRGLLATLLVVGLMQAAGWDGLGAGVLLGLALGVLPTAILSGAVVHEGVPVALAAIHALDWVVKLALIGALVGLLA